MLADIMLLNPSSGSNWILTLGTTSVTTIRDAVFAPSGTIYATGWSNVQGAGLYDGVIMKINSDGSLAWQRLLGGASNDYLWSVVIDSSENVYVAGYEASQTSGVDDIYLAKYNSSGTIQWQVYLGNSEQNRIYKMSIDSSANVYVAGSTVISGAGYCYIAKYNSSGTLQWQRTLTSTSATMNYYGCAVDSGGNVYAVGHTNALAASDCLIVKYNSSGVIQWQNRLNGSFIDYFRNISIDPSDNIYVSGYTQVSSGGTYDGLVAKYNTSGVLQWQRTIGATGSTETIDGCYADSSGNVYICGQAASQTAGSGDMFVAKWNSSGTLQWQRNLGTTGSDGSFNIYANTTDFIFSGTTPIGGVLAKLPADGSKTGVYGSFTYAATTFPEQAGTLATGTFSLTDAAGPLVSNTATLTSQTGTITTSVTNV